MLAYRPKGGMAMLRGPRQDPYRFEKRYWLCVLLLVVLATLGHLFADRLPRSKPELYLVPVPQNPGPTEEQWKSVPVPLNPKPIEVSAEAADYAG